MKSVYIRIHDEKEYHDIIMGAMLSDWLFSFPGGPTNYEQVRKNYHGNSKLLMRLFYNDITRKYEMQVTTASVEKSYPQIKSIKAIDWSEASYEYVRGIIGEHIPAVDRRRTA